MIQKEALPAPREITFEANPGKLQEMVDSAVNRALINQCGVLSNTVFNAAARTFKEGQVPPSYVGPAYHQPGPRWLRLHRLLRSLRVQKLLPLQAR